MLQNVTIQQCRCMGKLPKLLNFYISFKRGFQLISRYLCPQPKVDTNRYFFYKNATHSDSPKMKIYNRLQLIKIAQKKKKNSCKKSPMKTSQGVPPESPR